MFALLGDAVGHPFGLYKLFVGVLEGDEGLLLQDAVVHLHVLVFNLLDLFFAEGYVQRSRPIDPFRGLLLLAAYLRNLLEKDTVLSLDFGVLALQKIVLLWVFV